MSMTRLMSKTELMMRLDLASSKDEKLAFLVSNNMIECESSHVVSGIVTSDGCIMFFNTDGEETEAPDQFMFADYVAGLDIHEVKLPASMSSVPEHFMYKFKNLEKVYIPDTVKQICIAAFAYCTNLRHVRIPDTCKLNATAFYKCSSLESIELPKSLKSLPDTTFMYASSLKSVDIPDNVEIIGRRAFLNCESLKSISLSSSLKFITEEAFYNCTSLKEVKLPDGLVLIDKRAFAGCTSLEEITIPKSVKSIVDRAFENCTSLRKVRLSRDLLDKLRACSGMSWTGCRIGCPCNIDFECI